MYVYCFNTAMSHAKKLKIYTQKPKTMEILVEFLSVYSMVYIQPVSIVLIST